MPDPRPPFDLGQGQDRAIANVLTRATYAVTTPAQSADAVDLGCYPDIPLNAARFMCNIHLAHRMTLARKQRAPVRFIDVGCGSGLKVALAAQVFGQADGLDYDAGYAAAATRILAAMGAAHSRVFQADAMTFDGFAGYEVIYFYEPMYEPGLMTLEARVIGAARPGTIVIAPSQRFIQRAAGLGLVRINDAVYLKGEPSDGVEALITETRRMGPHFVGPDHRLPPEATWVAPLWHACLANGIDPDQTPVGSANGDSG